MNIDKYKKDDGYYDEEGCFYGDAEEFLSTKILGFCGCGMPQESLKYVMGALQLIKERVDKDYKQIKAEEDAYYKSDGAKYFMWYFLDNKGFTEHGGSVPGWLTVDGKELLEDITEWLNSEPTPEVSDTTQADSSNQS